MRRLDNLQRQPVARRLGMGRPQLLVRRPLQRETAQIDNPAFAQLVQAQPQIQHQRQIALTHLVEHRPRPGAPRGITKGPAQFRADPGRADRPAKRNPRPAMHAEHHKAAPVIGKQQRFVPGQRQGRIGIGLCRHDAGGLSQVCLGRRRGMQARNPQQQRQRGHGHQQGQHKTGPQGAGGLLIGCKLPPQFRRIGRALMRKDQHEPDRQDQPKHQHEPDR